MRYVQAFLLLLLTARVLAQVPPPPPPPLGPPPAPPGNPVTAAKANLGKTLFWDEQLSTHRTVSCGSCHQGASGGADPRSILGGVRSLNPGADGLFHTDDDVTGSPGVPLRGADQLYQWSSTYGMHEQVTGRKAVTMINAAYFTQLFWDGRAGEAFVDPISGQTVLTNGAALETQVLSPPVSSTEMAHVGRLWSDVAARVGGVQPLALSPAVPAALTAWINGRGYPDLFNEAFGTNDVTPARIAMAIATYERTLYSNQTPFDDLNGGNATALTAAEQRGLDVFTGPGGCAACHGGNLLSDNIFHNTGVRPAIEDEGRFVVTGNNADRGSFLTPTLRNVELRPPFMHNGKFATLKDVVDFYDRGGDFNAPNKDVRIHPLNLTDQQKSDLVAFLKRPLTDPRVAGEQAPFDRPTLYAESGRVPLVGGLGVAGADGIIPSVVAIEPPVAGNFTFTVGVYGGLGGTTATLVIDSSDPGAGPSIPGEPSFARVITKLGGSGAGNGYGSATMAIPGNKPALIGATFYGRWYLQDAAAPGGIAVTPVFQMTIFGNAVVLNGVRWDWGKMR